MANTIRVQTPLTQEVIDTLQAGDKVLLCGDIYTGRDAAHGRLIEALNRGEDLPIDVDGQVIYYVGPAPAKPGAVIGSAGPTTSYRMDDLTLPLLERGLRGMIGKGARAPKVIEGMKTHGAVYFGAIGGAGALITSTIKESQVIAYDDLGPEAIRRLRVEDMPVYVVIDAKGNNMYDTERAKYARED